MISSHYISSVKPHDAAAITRFQDMIGKQAGAGLIIYAGKQALRLSERSCAIPFDYKLAPSSNEYARS